MSAPKRYVHSPEQLQRARGVQWVRLMEGSRLVHVRRNADGVYACLACNKPHECKHTREARRQLGETLPPVESPPMPSSPTERHLQAALRKYLDEGGKLEDLPTVVIDGRLFYHVPNVSAPILGYDGKPQEVPDSVPHPDAFDHERFY